MYTMLDYALKYLSHGFVCVPLTRNGRHLDLPALGYDPLHLQTRRNKLKELCFSSITFELSQSSKAGSPNVTAISASSAGTRTSSFWILIIPPPFVGGKN